MINKEKILYSETSGFKNTWVMYLLVIIFLISLSITVSAFWNVNGQTTEKVISVLISVVAFSLIGIVLYITKLEFYLMEDGISFRFFPLQIKYKEIKYEIIQKYSIRKYSPIFEYGGWGIRYSFKYGRAYNVSGNTGLQLEIMEKGKSTKVLFGTQTPEKLFAVLDNCMKKIKSGNSNVEN